MTLEGLSYVHRDGNPDLKWKNLSRYVGRLRRCPIPSHLVRRFLPNRPLQLQIPLPFTRSLGYPRSNKNMNQDRLHLFPSRNPLPLPPFQALHPLRKYQILIWVPTLHTHSDPSEQPLRFLQRRHLLPHIFHLLR